MHILMYHSIGRRRDRFCVAPDAFARQMRTLAETDRPVLALRDAMDVPNSGKTPVVITFDDGFADNYCEALAVLKEHGLPATVFLVTGAMGERTVWHDPDPDAPVLRWEQVREMAQEGIEFGSHSLTHLDVRHADRENVREELVRSKATIEQHTGQEVVSFAYPYGYFRPEMPELLAKAGYECAVLAGTYGRNTPTTSRYELHRIPVWRRDSALTFRWKVRGRFWWRYYTQRLNEEMRWAWRQVLTRAGVSA